MKNLKIVLLTLSLFAAQFSMAEPNEDLVKAIEEKNIENLKAAIDAGADVNQTFEHYLLWQLNRTKFKKFTPLMLASAAGFSEGVLYLLHAKAKVKATANGGVGVYYKTFPVSSVKDVTALHLACGNGHAEVVKLLIQAKANKIQIMAIKANALKNKQGFGYVDFANGVANFLPKKWAKKNGHENVVALLKESRKAKWAKAGLPSID